MCIVKADQKTQMINMYVGGYMKEQMLVDLD